MESPAGNPLFRRGVVLWLGLLALACATDPADREYFAALRGEETGMTREQQIARLDLAIQMAPGRAHFFETRAIYRIDLRQFDRARADLDRVIELADRPYARFLRGLVSCQAGDYARSLPDFDDAVVRQPVNSQFYRGRSLARAAVGNAVGAWTDAEHLVATAPQQGESFHARGVARMLLGRDREAIADFDRALEIRSDLVYAAEARARALERMGHAAGVDRDAIERLRAEHSGCAACIDPFRY